ISSNDAIVIYRVDGVSGLNVLTGIIQIALGEADLVTFLKCDDGLFPIRSFTCRCRPWPAIFAAYVKGVDPFHFDVEKLLNSLANLHLVGPSIRDNRILVKLLSLRSAFFSHPDCLD